MNLYALLAQAARRFPDAGAVYRGTEPVHDYATLDLRQRLAPAGTGEDASKNVSEDAGER